MDEDAVSAALEEAGLVASFQDAEASDTVEAGNFVRSDPESGASVEIVDEEDRTVLVWMSAGPDSIAIPDISGMSQQEARQALEAAGFNPANFSTETENIPGGPRARPTVPSRPPAVTPLRTRRS